MPNLNLLTKEFPFADQNEDEVRRNIRESSDQDIAMKYVNTMIFLLLPQARKEVAKRIGRDPDDPATDDAAVEALSVIFRLLKAEIDDRGMEVEVQDVIRVPHGND